MLFRIVEVGCPSSLLCSWFWSKGNRRHGEFWIHSFPLLTSTSHLLVYNLQAWLTQRVCISHIHRSSIRCRRTRMWLTPVFLLLFFSPLHQLLQSPAFHRYVRRVHRSVHELRHGKGSASHFIRDEDYHHLGGMNIEREPLCPHHPHHHHHHLRTIYTTHAEIKWKFDDSAKLIMVGQVRGCFIPRSASLSCSWKRFVISGERILRSHRQGAGDDARYGFIVIMVMTLMA